MWVWWQSDFHQARDEIPYSEFVQYLETDQVDKVLVGDTYIQGILKLKDEKSGKPRQAN